MTSPHPGNQAPDSPEDAGDPSIAAAGSVTVRYWAGARAAAGVREEMLPIGSRLGTATGGATDPVSAADSVGSGVGTATSGDSVGGADSVGSVLAAAVAAHPDLAPIVPLCSVLVDGLRVDATFVLVAGAQLDVLPPFAGG